MSQKVSRRTRRQTTEDSLSSPAKSDNSIAERTPTPQSIITESNEFQNETVNLELVPEENSIISNGGDKDIAESKVLEESASINNRSREVTPTNKMNGCEENAESIPKESEDLADVEMDSLVVTDEPDPELVFEENSDLESGQHSPVLSRCKTRRSLTRNAPTPKTPKPSEENLVTETPVSTEDQDLNTSYESCLDDLSTQAEAGGDSTRLDFSNLEFTAFVQVNKSKTFQETLRHLSSRRSIRPINNEDYRRKLLDSQINKNKMEGNYPQRYSVERVSSVGLKRKNDIDDQDGTKRFKHDSPGFFSRFTSPLASIRSSFRSNGDVASSTPKLTGYKDEKYLLEDDKTKTKACNVNIDDEQKRWCVIM